jgi:hypothetical protein
MDRVRVKVGEVVNMIDFALDSQAVRTFAHLVDDDKFEELSKVQSCPVKIVVYSDGSLELTSDLS